MYIYVATRFEKITYIFFHQSALNLIWIKSTHVENFFKVLYVTFGTKSTHFEKDFQSALIM